MLTDNQMKAVAGMQRKALLSGVAGSAIALVGGVLLALFKDGVGLEALFQPFLVAYLLVFGMGVCGLAVVMVHHLCGGAWSFMIQRICEAMSRTIPFLFLLGLVVILLGAFTTHLYNWTNPEYLYKHHVVTEKEAFLNLPVFALCYFIYFGIWAGLAMIYNRWSDRLDSTGDLNIISKMQALAGPGLILYVLTMTFAATHWAMSLEPEWFSSIYPGWMMSGHILAVLAFAVLMLSFLAKEGPVAEKVTQRHFHHLGTFLCGFTIFWSYISFSQFLIIWSGNLPEGIGFYIHRSGDTLNILTLILIIVNFAIPMFYLFVRRNKTDIRKLRFIAIWILSVRIIDMYWNIVPSWEGYRHEISIPMVVMVLGALAGLGGFWFYLFLKNLQVRPVLPQNDPRGETFFLKDAHHHA